ncbi:TAFII55 protein conserved region-domain-containing protein [Tuber brumale]|nr:TAFII55 protein conserved region-domain-containing protein [Tuber brumale]
MVKLKINTALSAAADKKNNKVSSPKVTAPKIKIKTKTTGGPTLKLRTPSISQPPSAAAPGALNSPAPIKTPVVKFKTKATHNAHKPRRREPGNGYDSEASDREDDPAIEEQFILRMQPGEDCEYIREVIEKKELNVTTDVWMKFKDSRRAVVGVRGNLYSALLVDLPCIIESNKTLDKKAIFKTADISQMLVVGDRIDREEEVLTVPARPQDITYPHGVTPPMHYVRKRRFRKRISNRTIEAVEAEVERLLAEDAKAESSKFSLVDAVELEREEINAMSDVDPNEGSYDLLGDQEYDYDQDAEGEIDEDYPGAVGAVGAGDDVDVDGDTLANDLESALMDEGPDADGDNTGGNALHPSGQNGTVAATPAEEESEDDDDDDEEEEAGELDEDATEAAQVREKLREEIHDLQTAIRAKERELSKITNNLLRGRVELVISNLQCELDMKMLQATGGKPQ